MSENNLQTAQALSEAIRSGRQSVAAILETYLARIEAENGYHHAFRTVFASEARQQAAILDAELAAGNWRGPLHGIPVAVKDNIAIAGHAARAGSMSACAVVAGTDAPAVARLREAGAIILGQTHMVEFAFGGWGTNSAAGTPRNPLDPHHHRVPGGSSSGSAVAVAAGLVPLAVGTDTGGSVRIPASMNGLAGFKPSAGRVPDAGLVPLCRPFDVIGPLGRTVADCWILFEALSHLPGGGVRPLPVLDRPVRLGMADPVAYGSASSRVLEAYHRSCAALAESGWQLEPFSFPVDVHEVLSRTAVLIGFDAVEEFGGLLETVPDVLDRGVRYRLTDARRYSVDDRAREWQRREQSCREMIERMSGFDAILFPTTPILPPRLDEIVERAMPLGDLTRVVNYLDLGAMAIPTETTPEGLRHSLQVIGRKGDDELVFAISSEIEARLGSVDGEA